MTDLTVSKEILEALGAQCVEVLPEGVVGKIGDYWLILSESRSNAHVSEFWIIIRNEVWRILVMSLSSHWRDEREKILFGLQGRLLLRGYEI